MKNSFVKIMVTIFVLLSATINAQVKNAKTEQVKIFGNCGMCKSKIEQAGSVKKITIVKWDSETKVATITYNASKTNVDEVLKRIAAVGYDSEKFQAPDEVYDNLHGCCQYDRPAKTVVPTKE